jgi:tRNA-uridine 2-sulfurtransferase
VWRDASTGRYQLGRGVDVGKDQSYVLFGLQQSQLARTLLPLGAYTKDVVRALAQERGYLTAEKPESQDICFLRGQPKETFLAPRMAAQPAPGLIVDQQGRILGSHEGAWRYTVGQREGLGVAAPHRLYVLHVDTRANRVTVGPREALAQQQCTIERYNGIARQWASGDVFEALVQVRAHATPVAATVQVHAATATLTVHTPHTAVSPGQAAVCYQDDIVLGGGWVCAAPALTAREDAAPHAIVTAV